MKRIINRADGTSHPFLFWSTELFKKKYLGAENCFFQMDYATKCKSFMIINASAFIND